MKREILFRAKDKETNEWVEGFIMNENQDMIGFYNNCFEFKFRPCLPETVGQYTGIKDKNGKKVYEGDIVWGDTIEGDWHKGVVEYDEDMGQYFVNAKNFMQYEKNSDSWSMLGRWTVEGNIFDK